MKIAFLSGELDEEIYIERPEGFVVLGQEKKVYKLAKSLYGLKQVAKQWCKKFDHAIIIVPKFWLKSPKIARWNPKLALR